MEYFSNSSLMTREAGTTGPIAAEVQPMYGQRAYMRKLVSEQGLDKSAVCAAYVRAEREGIVKRKRNSYRMDAEDYALELWRHGCRRMKKGKSWLLQTS